MRPDRTGAKTRRLLSAGSGWILAVGTLLVVPWPATAQTIGETLSRLAAEKAAADRSSKEVAEDRTQSATPEGTAQRPFTDIIDVRLVEVETVVTAKNGDRVRGLDRGDFRLLVDGNEVPIEVFEEVSEGVAIAEGDRTRLTEAPSEAPMEKAEIGRDILIFVDDYFTDRGTRKRLLKNLANNLDPLGPGDRMAVVRFAGWGLEILSEWTSSKEDLSRVIEELRKETPGELTRSSQLDSMSDPILGLDDAKLSDRRQIQQIYDVLKAMAVAMRTFSDGPGRKLFVPVTAGWNFDQLRTNQGPAALATAEIARDAGNIAAPAPPLQYLNAAGAPTPAGRGELSRQAEMGDVYGDTVLSPLVDTANLLGFSIYPMHIGRPPAGGDEVQRTALWLVAAETGGQIVTEGGASLTPLEPVVADTGSYYVLGFSPDRAFDDHRHTVEVEVTRPEGAKVRHRESFMDLSRASRDAMKSEEAILLGGTGGDLDVTVGEVRSGQGNRVEVPLTLRIPMDWVTMVPQGKNVKEYVGELELRVAAMERDGRRSETTVVPVRLTGPEPPPGSVATYETAVEIRGRGDQRLILYLYDQLSGASKAAAVELSL
jgi:VWFA-related protein